MIVGCEGSGRGMQESRGNCSEGGGGDCGGGSGASMDPF